MKGLVFRGGGWCGARAEQGQNAKYSVKGLVLRGGGWRGARAEQGQSPKNSVKGLVLGGGGWSGERRKARPTPSSFRPVLIPSCPRAVPSSPSPSSSLRPVLVPSRPLPRPRAILVLVLVLLTSHPVLFLSVLAPPVPSSLPGRPCPRSRRRPVPSSPSPSPSFRPLLALVLVQSSPPGVLKDNAAAAFPI